MKDCFKGEKYIAEIEWGKIKVIEIGSNKVVLNEDCKRLYNVSIRSNEVTISKSSFSSDAIKMSFKFNSDAKGFYDRLQKDRLKIYKIDVDEQYVYAYDYMSDRHIHCDNKILLHNIKDVYTEDSSLVVVDGEYKYSPKKYTFLMRSKSDALTASTNIKKHIDIELEKSTQNTSLNNHVKNVKQSNRVLNDENDYDDNIDNPSTIGAKPVLQSSLEQSNEYQKKKRKWIAPVIVLVIIALIFPKGNDLSKINSPSEPSFLYYVETLYEMNVRFGPSKTDEKVRVIKKGTECKVYQVVKGDDYVWYRIGDNEWIADNGTWYNIYNNCAYSGEKLMALNAILNNYEEFGFFREYTKHHFYENPAGYVWYWVVIEKSITTYSIGLFVESGGEGWVEWYGEVVKTGETSYSVTSNQGFSDKDFEYGWLECPIKNIRE